MKDLSVIIPSYNTKDITVQCVKSLAKSLANSTIDSEIIIVDNASGDGSTEAVTALESESTQKLQIRSILLKENTGYAHGNNTGWKTAEGRYVLFLNSDMIIDNVDFAELISYMNENTKVGALTVRVNLKKGDIDPASHRGFPTLWRSFTYFSGLERLLNFPGFNKIFGGYHLLHRSFDSIHEIDSPSGAFYLVRNDVLKQVGGFDEDFFMYGEDIDLSYRIKALHYSIMYYPTYQVTHLKYSSGLGNTDPAIKKNIREHFYHAMKIFYDKHYKAQYPAFVQPLVHLLIDIKYKLT